MSPHRHRAGRARLTRAIVALVAVSASLGAVAYAATRPEGGDAGLGSNKPVALAPGQGGGTGTHGAEAPKGEERSPLARFLEAPESTSSAAEVQFRFHVAPRTQPLAAPAPAPGPAAEAPPARRFQCRLDGTDWSGCSSPYRLPGLTLGDHSFAVRALGRSGRPGPAVSYSWRQVERRAPAPPAPAQEAAEAQVDPMPFAIEALNGGVIDDLFPGYPAEQLPVRISNPNSAPIEVTSVTVAIASEPPSCPAENFELTPSSVSPAEPVVVPAGGSAGLPTETVSAPEIQMLNLPVNQDACRGAQVQLAFSGEAHG